MKKTVLILLAFFALTSVIAQKNLNDYKYIVVPEKFEFLKEADQFKINSLTKFLFEKYNFEAVMENDEVMPSDFRNNSCLVLKADVLEDSSMFKTKLLVQLKDCNNQVVYTSRIGESREKSYNRAYNIALRNAFKSFETVDYRYNSNNDIAKEKDLEIEKKKELQNLKDEIKTLKEEKTLVKKQPEQTIIKSKVDKKTISVSPWPKTSELLVVLYAQKIENGFQLVDKTPKVIYKIKETGLSNVFLVEGNNAIMYKLDANWMLEYYKNEKLQTKIINIKF